MNRIIITIYALILLSINCFSQWEQISAGMNGGFVHAIKINNNKIYIGTYDDPTGNGNIYISTNKGISWKYSRLNNNTIYCIEKKDNLIFAGTQYNGLYVSSNEGNTWLQTTINSGIVNSINVFDKYILAATGTKLYRSSDNGQSWLSIDSLLFLRYLKSDSIRIFAGSDYGLYYSTDIGENWTLTNFTTTLTWALEINNGYLIASSFPGIYCSTNYGNNWTFGGIGNYMNKITAI